MSRIISHRLFNIALPLALLAGSVGAAESQRLNFVACPVFQDTSTVPCWLAEYQGETYFLGIQTDSGGWTPPLQGHQVLVEGVVTAQPRVCGGVVLASSGSVFDKRPSGKSAGVDLPQPPVISTMRELDSNCRTMLPENPRYNTLEPRRGPGPGNAQIAGLNTGAPRGAPAEALKPPFTAKTFELHYEFDSELAGLTINKLQEALKYAGDINAKTLEIVSHRASVKLSNGKQLDEIPKIAEFRAKELSNVIRMFGLPKGAELKVRVVAGVQPGNGIDDWTRRRSDIIVSP